MLVLKTTSPTASPSAPNERPSKTVPSASAKSAFFTDPSTSRLPHHLASDQRGHRRTGKPPSGKRRIPAPGGKGRGIRRPITIRIEDRQIGVSALSDPALWELQDARRLAGELCDHLRQAQHAWGYQRRERDSKRCLQADYATGSQIKLPLLLLNCVGGVIRRNHVDGAVPQPRQ